MKKIKNFVIRNPYWSTLFFPFVPIIILILLFIYTDSTNPYGLVTTTTATPNPFLQIISNIWSITAPYIFLFGILGWIIYCIVVVGKEKRVKLIVLFFSICILAFLLFFVYTIWIHSINHPPRAKSSVTKFMHKEMAMYINAEMARCIIDETTAMNGNLTCSGRTADSVIAAAVIATKDVQMNPYELDKSAVTSGGTNTSDSDVGYIRLSVSGENIIIKTCHTKPCATKNQSSKTIALQ